MSSAFGLKEWVGKLKIPTAFTFVLSKFPSAIFILTVALLSTVGRVGVFFLKLTRRVVTSLVSERVEYFFRPIQCSLRELRLRGVFT